MIHFNDVLMENNSYENFIQKYGHLRPSTYDICSPTYAERKKLSISITNSILLENHKINNWLSLFLAHTKKDDLADSFLQGLWYIKHKL